MGVLIYITFGLPLFVAPFFHLHKLMKERRRSYVDQVTTTVNDMFLAQYRDTISGNVNNISDRISALDYIEKYRKIANSLPLWPLPIKISAPPLGSLVAASLPLAIKLLNGTLEKVGALVP
ncbi:hypothetical protein F1643_04880 [Azospirillum sp. INR13]|uniref:hypothetical protein n=1 Tax=Azospirillum sp. INR13 TaxID=2596919 RepID=UPI0018924DB3|nr:hypothetical protein [Azospirillum sp. INR13]MBF5093919.1 hypothetical protein [Azospirillum sp. INR13]